MPRSLRKRHQSAGGKGEKKREKRKRGGSLTILTERQCGTPRKGISDSGKGSVSMKFPEKDSFSILTGKKS